MKLIDISHTLNENTPVYPGDTQTTLSLYKTIEKDYFNAYRLQTGLHTGTHIDIPMHLLDDNKTVADYPLTHFYGKGVLLDVRGESTIQMKPLYNEMVGPQDIVLLLTGYDAYYGKSEYFTHHPAVSDDLAEFLLSQRIKMLGMDMPAPDYPPFTFHKELLRNNILVLENLTNLQSLAAVDHFEVIALPLKITAEASLVRAVCKIND